MYHPAEAPINSVAPLNDHDREIPQNPSGAVISRRTSIKRPRILAFAGVDAPIGLPHISRGTCRMRASLGKGFSVALLVLTGGLVAMACGGRASKRATTSPTPPPIAEWQRPSRM